MQAAALIPAVLFLYLGLRCLKHAAVIVTPLGVEILPFVRPRHTMRWHLWQQICSAERDGTRLTLRLADGTNTIIGMAPLDGIQPGHAGPCRSGAPQLPASIRLW